MKSFTQLHEKRVNDAYYEIQASGQYTHVDRGVKLFVKVIV